MSWPVAFWLSWTAFAAYLIIRAVLKSDLGPRPKGMASPPEAPAAKPLTSLQLAFHGPKPSISIEADGVWLRWTDREVRLHFDPGSCSFEDRSIKLLAHDPESGWAFIQAHKRILLVKPPYEKVPEYADMDDVERSVTVGGYQACDTVFADGGALHQFLRAATVASAGPIDEDALRQSLVEGADPAELDSYLAMAEGWVRSGQLGHVLALVEGLLEAPGATTEQRERLKSLRHQVLAKMGG